MTLEDAFQILMYMSEHGLLCASPSEKSVFTDEETQKAVEVLLKHHISSAQNHCNNHLEHEISDVRISSSVIKRKTSSGFETRDNTNQRSGHQSKGSGFIWDEYEAEHHLEKTNFDERLNTEPNEHETENSEKNEMTLTSEQGNGFDHEDILSVIEEEISDKLDYAYSNSCRAYVDSAF